MRYIAVLIAILAQPALAFDYELAAERECTYASNRYECVKSSERTLLRQVRGGRWQGVNPDGRAVDLTVMKEDEYVLILEDPVLYSGASIIHVMKKTGRFFWSKCSYSEILKEDDSTVRVGKLILKAQR